jgi:hypothetical protein
MGWSQYLRRYSRAPLEKGARRSESSATRLSIEALEPRIALAAAGLVPIGEQPEGPLTGKIVYTSGGHGWQWNSGLNRYATDRPEYGPEIVEDFGNQDQMSYYVDYLFRAGATVVPMRPVGHQINEVVLDNDSPGVTFTGAWSNSGSTRYYDEDYGTGADAVPYRFASTTAGAATATANYTPNIPEAGFYPVYTWVLRGTDRTLQEYTVKHTGGSTVVRVDHSMVGSGWVYLGTYHFAAGSSQAEGSVEISNHATAGNVVIADAIRFGNGVGDSTVSGGPGPSGYRREDENSWHWIARSIGVGTSLSTAIGSANNVSAPSNFAEYMNADTNPFGTSVYISFHSNGSTGNPATATARGVLGLVDSDQGTPNQTALANFTGGQINDDMMALNGMFEHTWFNRNTHSLAGGFGEIDLGSGAEMDATIVEVGFHDNTQDSQLLRDPRVRDQIARSTYVATLQYFDAFGGLNAPVATASAPVNLRVTSGASGQVTLNWAAGPGGVQGGAATGYRIYASTNGYGFDGGTYVAGGGTTSATLAGYDPSLPYFFKIVAENAGGESRGSEVVTVTPDGAARNVLIVTGFDRQERSQNVRYPYAYSDGFVDRVWERSNNSYDYVVQYASALHAAAPEVTFDTASNEAVINGAVLLNQYDSVIWILGEESTSTDTFTATEQSRVSSYLAAGGNLFLSGSEIGWDLDAQGGGASFYNNVLRADYIADDANSYTASATVGGIFAGIPSVSFSNGAGYNFYDVNAPDRIAPFAGSIAALNYSTGGAAAIQYVDAGTDSKLVMLAFPFEAITAANVRNSIMQRVLEFFVVGEPPTEVDIVLDNDDGLGVYGETGTWTQAGAPGYNGSTYRFASAGSDAAATWQFYAPFAGRAEVFVYYAAASNRVDNATYVIRTGTPGGGAENISINQKINGSTWVSLGEFDFAQGLRAIALYASTSTGGSVVIADAVRVVLTTATDPNADFDADGIIDGADFLAWQRGVGIADPELANGDADGSGDVDGADLAVWAEQFGTAGPEGGLVAATLFSSAPATYTLAAASSTSESPEAPGWEWLAQRMSSPVVLGLKSADFVEERVMPFTVAAESAVALWTPTRSERILESVASGEEQAEDEELAALDASFNLIADWPAFGE